MNEPVAPDATVDLVITDDLQPATDAILAAEARVQALNIGTIGHINTGRVATGAKAAMLLAMMAPAILSETAHTDEATTAIDRELARGLERKRKAAAKFSPYTRWLYQADRPILTQDGPFKRQDAAKARSLEIAAMSNSEKKRQGLLPKKPNKRK